MNLLAIDTSMQNCSITLSYKNKQFTDHLIAKQSHNKHILPMINGLLNRFNITLNQLDVIAFAKGPGSFTGIRVGIGVAQGLAYGASLPLVGISTLAILAQKAIEQYKAKHILVATDARMNEVYCGFYQQNHLGLAALVNQEQVTAPNLLTSISYTDVVGAGNGWQVYQQQLAEIFPTIISYPQIACSEAEFMIPLAKYAYQNKQLIHAINAHPSYLRQQIA